MINFKDYNKILNITESNNGEEYNSLVNDFSIALDSELSPYVTVGIRKILGFIMVVDLWGAEDGGNRSTHSQLASYMMHVDEGDTKFNYLHGNLRALSIKPMMARKYKTQSEAVVKLAQWFNKNKKAFLGKINKVSNG